MNNYYGEANYNNSYVRNQNPESIINFANHNNSEILQYGENILNMNKGKNVNIYMSFPDSIEWRDKVFHGTIESVGSDYILIKDINKNPILLQKIYINFIEFNESINY